MTKYAWRQERGNDPYHSVLIDFPTFMINQTDNKSNQSSFKFKLNLTNDIIISIWTDQRQIQDNL